MHFDQLVITVAGGTVEVQGLSPNLDQDLMYRLMNMAPSIVDMEDHLLPAYSYSVFDDTAVFGRTFFKGVGTAQTNLIVGPIRQLSSFRNNPALFSFISNAEGLLHNKDLECPNLPELDFADTVSRFDPVFESNRMAELAIETINEIDENGKAAVIGIEQPFRFLIPLIGLLENEHRVPFPFCVNSSYLPKNEQFKLLVFPSVSSSLLQKLEDAEYRALELSEFAHV